MKFYKILNSGERHHGMQYKTGLNTDVLDFNPSGDCKPGGIYFSREDILYFLNYGVWIREVRIPKGEEVYLNPYNPVKWKAHRVILGKRRKITIKVIFNLIKEGADYNHLDLFCFSNIFLKDRFIDIELLLHVILKREGIKSIGHYLRCILYHNRIYNNIRQFRRLWKRIISYLLSKYKPSTVIGILNKDILEIISSNYANRAYVSYFKRQISKIEKLR